MELIHVKQAGELSTYDIAKQALALAVTVDEAKTIHDDAERMAFYARQANDRELIADAMALVMMARRRLGELLIKAKEAGQLSRGGRPSKELHSGSGPGQPRGETGSKSERVTLKEAGIDRKLSSEAQKLAGYAEDDFEAVIERGREKIRAGGAVVINPVKDLNTREKQLHRDVREAVLAAKQKALPEKKFGIILEDPEWPFDVWSVAGMDRSADNHYPTSALEVIEARDVPSIAADDCVLFLWVTAPHHAAGNGAVIMRARGFEPKAEIIWNKVEVGTGFWFRNQHEVLLVGVRGKVPAPAMGTQWPSIITSPKGVHSEKPDWAYELIEAYFPNLPKIELNARRRRDGWDAWGFEAPDDANSSDVAVLDAADPQRSGSAPSDDAERATSEAILATSAGRSHSLMRDSIRPDELVEPVGGVTLAASPAALNTVAAGPSGNVGGAGESVTALPDAPVASAIKHTKDSARPILEAKYATSSAEELSAELGVPVPTVRTWAFRLGLTSRARIAQMARERNKARGGHQQEAGEHAHD
jgi:N6-adenosine-specific RNA methylase IME4